MKICIFGAGAIGGLVGLALARAGADVSLIARGDHLAAIQKNGLTLLSGKDRQNIQLPASNRPRVPGTQDIVIVALKAHQAWQAVDQIAALLSPDTTVITMQNGIPWWYFHAHEGELANHRLTSVDPGNRQWELLGPERVVGCVVYAACEVRAPGVIAHSFGNRFIFGTPDGSTPAHLAELIALLDNGILQGSIAENIRQDIWLKLWGNLCFNPVSALTGATLDIIGTDPGTRKIACKMMEEAQTIAEKLGIAFPMDIETRLKQAVSVGTHKSSMLQDKEKGRKIELDAILGAVQEMGRLVAVSTPTIDMIMALTSQMGQQQGIYPAFSDSGN